MIWMGPHWMVMDSRIAFNGSSNYTEKGAVDYTTGPLEFPSRRKTDFSVFCRLGPSRGCIKAATKQFVVDWDCRLGWVVFSFVDWTCWILFPIPPIIRLGCKKNPPCRSQIKSHTTLCTAGAAAPGALENNGEGVSGASVRRGVGRM